MCARKILERKSGREESLCARWRSISFREKKKEKKENVCTGFQWVLQGFSLEFGKWEGELRVSWAHQILERSSTFSQARLLMIRSIQRIGRHRSKEFDQHRPSIGLYNELALVRSQSDRKPHVDDPQRSDILCGCITMIKLSRRWSDCGDLLPAQRYCVLNTL